MFRWFEEGKLKPAASKLYPLDLVPEAMDDLLTRRATGKLVIAVR